jgi:F0F1-type ATP synthase assembly protein I
MTEKDNNGSNGVNKTYRELAPYLGLGLQLAATVIIMVFLGIWLDKKFNSGPYLTVICSALGVFAALYNFIKSVLKSNK